MPKEKKVRYYIRGVPTEAQMRIIVDKLCDDEEARLAKAKAKPTRKPKQKTQKTMKLRRGVEVLCKEDSCDAPYTCLNRTEAEKKAAALGPGWMLYQGIGPKFYVARKKGVSKHEKLLLAKLDNGIVVLAIGGGKDVGQPRYWGGDNGESNAARNAKALGTNWTVYRIGEDFYVALVKQSALPLFNGHA